MALAFQASATGLAPVTCPSTAAGDIIVYVERGIPGGGEAYPSGFTGVPTLYANDGTYGIAFSWKIADGTEGGTSIAGMTGLRRGIIMTFRDSSGGWNGAVARSPVKAGFTNSNPASQTVTAASGNPPLVIVAAYAANSAIGTPTFSPSETGTVSDTTSFLAKYKVYDSSPSDTSIDKGDDGTSNYVGGFYLEKLASTNGALAVTEAGDTVSSAARRTTHAALAVTEAADTVAATARRTTHAAASITEAGDTLVAAVLPRRVGALAVTEAADTVAATARRTAHAALAVTEAADTVIAIGLPGRMGAVSATEADDILAMTGYTYIIPGWHPYEQGSVETWRAAIVQAEDWTPATKQSETWTRRTPAA